MSWPISPPNWSDRGRSAWRRCFAVGLCAALLGLPHATLAQEGRAGASDRLDDAVARARRGDFDEIGSALCAQDIGQPLQTCAAAVARSGPATAAVRVTFPNGFSRLLIFTGGVFVSADATMSGVGTDIDQRIAQDRHILRVEDQRYELDAALVFGPSQDP